MTTTEISGVQTMIWANTVDAHAQEEIRNLASLPFIFHHMAFMPDVHGGKGMPIGGVVATLGVVIPNAVGVDIGCGMCAVKTSLAADDIPSDVLRKQILRGIRKAIPIGMDRHGSPQDEAFMPQGFDVDTLTVVSRQYKAALRQVGTLGGGNHFIELQKDTEGHLWIMIHSGSRNLGKQVGDYYNEKAANLNKWFHSKVELDINLPFLPIQCPEHRQYWNEMNYCIEFALCNRKLMMERICSVIGEVYPEATFEPMINIAHNYAAWETHFGKNVIVHRKGATRARLGEVGIIPGSQGTKSYIVEGLGNPLSFQSCSHGAGRSLSRSEAVKTLDLEAEKRRLEDMGIVHAIRTVSDLQEAAGAYKDISEVMASQSDLVRPLVELSPVAVIKG